MEHSSQAESASFPGFVDLAAEKVGGRAVVASDEFFAPMENLVKPGRGVFIPDKYTDRGKWMDGWETRRKRELGHDWCVIQLGLPGIVFGIDVDTNHFLGNHPSYASVDGWASTEGGSSTEAFSREAAAWVEILPQSPLKPGSQNLFSVSNGRRWTHLRLQIYPDGGVARFRAYGRVVPEWGRFKIGEAIDLAAVENGGIVIAASDMFFGSKENLILPGKAGSMGEGWETRRRRGAGNDWAIVKLGKPGGIRRIEVDTHHFKGNFPDRCSIEGCNEPNAMMDALSWGKVAWKEILPQTKLLADRQHSFEKELADIGACSHVRLNIFPDGGVSRLRVYGVI